MIERHDLRAAVAAGILDEGQAVALSSLADSRRGARENLAPGDEPFELFRGFNEIFIVVGLVILATGWVAVAAVAATTQITDVFDMIVTRSMIGAVILWLLAEYFVRRRRMVAPAIALTVLFALNASAGFNAEFVQPFLLLQRDVSSLPLPFVLTTVAVFVFWLRFKVPIALAIIALGLFAAAVLFSASGGERPETLTDFFRLSAESGFAWLTLALGIGTFIVAMCYDMSDPHRVTRRATNGFWLHIIAAPALVNTIAVSLLTSDTSASLGLLLAFLALIAAVAIIIDRRSFLITGVGYVVMVRATLDDLTEVAVTILALGLVLLCLGAFWERIRAVLLRAFAPLLPLTRLPPAS
ncbi:MAG: hypothetical protein AAGP08_03160 [Pseudomonadota bacterium]